MFRILGVSLCSSKGGLVVEQRKKLWRLIFFFFWFVATAMPVLSFAQEAPPQPSGAPAVAAPTPPSAPQPKIDKGDTAWMLTSAALVLMMTIPGLFLFYGGLVRRKNALGTIMHSFIIVAVITIQWALWGYTLAFGPDIGGLIGSLDWFGLNGV